MNFGDEEISFNPHFVSIAFETTFSPDYKNQKGTFNPHFVSIAFETTGFSWYKKIVYVTFQSSFCEYRL